MSEQLETLVELLDLEYLEDNLYRGQSRNLGGKSVFGGQVVAQALVAAYRTVASNLVAHSLHSYFLRRGDMDYPIVYQVERIRDGRSFTARRVMAIQKGRPIFSMMASFQAPEYGLEHQAEMPDVPGPDELKEQLELRQDWINDCPEPFRDAFLRKLPIEIKPVSPRNPLKPDTRDPVQNNWFKAADVLPDDPMIHQCVMAYASDFTLLTTALHPHGVTWAQPDMTVASLDHAIWFHRPIKADDWWLYNMDSPMAVSGRGLSRGFIFDQAGKLLASTTQESLMRKYGLAEMQDGKLPPVGN
jgi:acyl-CoA thioesterase-2